MPRTSSAMSEFFFCGMMLEPVVNSSESSMNLNSQLDQSISSSLSRERCIMSMDRSAHSSTQ